MKTAYRSEVDPCSILHSIGGWPTRLRKISVVSDMAEIDRTDIHRAAGILEDVVALAIKIEDQRDAAVLNLSRIKALVAEWYKAGRDIHLTPSQAHPHYLKAAEVLASEVKPVARRPTITGGDV